MRGQHGLLPHATQRSLGQIRWAKLVMLESESTYKVLKYWFVCLEIKLIN